MSKIIIWGTHNTMSYLKPKNFIGRLFRWTSQCQSLTLEEQLNKGVRAFDIRVRFDSDGNPILCHGLVDYPGTLYGVLNEISARGRETSKLMYVRLVLETFILPPHDKDKKLFEQLCKKLHITYDRIRFQNCIKKPWKITSSYIIADIKECFKSPSTLLEVLKGPKRLLPLQSERLEKTLDLLTRRTTIIFLDFY